MPVFLLKMYLRSDYSRELYIFVHMYGQMPAFSTDQNSTMSGLWTYRSSSGTHPIRSNCSFLEFELLELQALP